jgi:hypothetical protein
MRKGIAKNLGKLVPVAALCLGAQTATAGFYGQVHRGYLWVDDGFQVSTYHVDVDYSSSRIGWKESFKLNDYWSAGAHIEVQLESNSTDDVNQANHSPNTSPSFGTRKVYWWAKCERMGKLSVGQRDTASDGTSEESMAVADVVASRTPADMAGGVFFHVKGTNTPATAAPRVNQYFYALDGGGRRNTVRYDSPEYMGFQFAAGMNQATNSAGGNWDVALRYSGTFDSLKVSAALGHLAEKNRKRTDGSIAFLHTPSGVNAAFAYGTDKLNENSTPNGTTTTAGSATSGSPFYNGRTQDPRFQAYQLGWNLDLYSVGATGVAAGYWRSKNYEANNRKGRAFSFGALQKVDKLNAQFYVAYYNMSIDLNSPTTEYDKIGLVMAAGRIKF